MPWRSGIPAAGLVLGSFFALRRSRLMPLGGRRRSARRSERDEAVGGPVPPGRGRDRLERPWESVLERYVRRAEREGLKGRDGASRSAGMKEEA